MTIYINYKGVEGNETIDEFDNPKEAIVALRHYQQSDRTGQYWTSSKPCKGWKTEETTTK